MIHIYHPSRLNMHIKIWMKNIRECYRNTKVRVAKIAVHCFYLSWLNIIIKGRPMGDSLCYKVSSSYFDNKFMFQLKMRFHDNHGFLSFLSNKLQYHFFTHLSMNNFFLLPNISHFISFLSIMYLASSVMYILSRAKTQLENLLSHLFISSHH